MNKYTLLNLKLLWFTECIYILKDNKRWEKLYFWLKVDDNTRQRIKESSFYWQRRLKYHYFRKKKNWRMRILGAVFFLSLLAGKFATFEQMLLTDQAFLKMAHAYYKRPYFFLKVFRWENVLSQTALSKNWTHKIHELTTF